MANNIVLFSKLPGLALILLTLTAYSDLKDQSSRFTASFSFSYLGIKEMGQENPCL